MIETATGIVIEDGDVRVRGSADVRAPEIDHGDRIDEGTLIRKGIETDIAMAIANGVGIQIPNGTGNGGETGLAAKRAVALDRERRMEKVESQLSSRTREVKSSVVFIVMG